MCLRRDSIISVHQRQSGFGFTWVLAVASLPVFMWFVSLPHTHTHTLTLAHFSPCCSFALFLFLPCYFTLLFFLPCSSDFFFLSRISYLSRNVSLLFFSSFFPFPYYTSNNASMNHYMALTFFWSLVLFLCEYKLCSTGSDSLFALLLNPTI
jgi:hypothetical protein